jgi:hypothetical protein
MTLQTTASLRRWKLPKRLTPYVFAFYMSAIMALLMCAVIVASHGALDATYVARVLHAYALAMPVAFVCVILVRPVVMRLVAATVQA